MVRWCWRCVRNTYLLVVCLTHATKNPDDPSTVGHLRNIPEFPLGAVFLNGAFAKKELEEPFGDEEQAEVVLLGDLRPLRLDVLEERRKQRCDICVSTRIYTDRKERMEKVTYD